MGRFSVVRLSTLGLLLITAATAKASGSYPHCLTLNAPATIAEDQKCVRVEKKITGDIVNKAVLGRTDKDNPGFFIGGHGLITGVLINNGTIQGGSEGWGALTLGRGADVKGGIENNGTIVSARGNAINLGHLDEWWHSQAAALTGDITNRGLIDGYDDGIAARFGTMSGALINEANGTITGRKHAVHIFDTFASWTAGIENKGLIEGGYGGILIENDLFEGGLTNAEAATIRALSGDGVFASAEWRGGLDNAGTIEGERDGFAYAGTDFHGGVANAGMIKGGRYGLRLTGSTFDGAFSNEGEIDGGLTGVAILFDHVAGAFLNSGTIDGGTGAGVEIDVATWGSTDDPADIVNAAAGRISGGTTGFALTAETVFGNFINNGKISGAAANTGITITASVFNGDIENDGEATAPSNALKLNISTLNGTVRNTGTIKTTGPNGVAADLAIGNGTTFANTDGGLIFGDVLLRGPAAYTFAAGTGGVEGDIIGTPFDGNDERLIVSGTHYFVTGAIRNFLNFDVENGGTALMGGRFIADPDGPGYASSNIDALTVRSGGQLYLDDDTILNVGTYTQSEDSELTLFLAAPMAGEPVAGVDYGRVNASGAVTLDGTLSLILDPASFGGTTQTEFKYVDIIKGASFIGEFDRTRIEGSTFFFTLAVTYGNTSIDLSVTRTPFDQTFCEQHLSRNSEDLGAALEAAFRAGGFTPEQIELFNFLGQLEDVCSAYFDLGGAILGDIHEITVETAGPWKSAVNDRLNATGATSCIVAGAGGCLTRYAANGPGATEVATDAEDPFAWLDVGLRPEGQLSFWGRLIGVQGDNRGRGIVGGSDFTVTGGIGGVDYVFTERFIAGVAAQWTNTDVDFKHRIDTAGVQSFEIGGYFSYGDVDFCINGNASIVFHDFDTYRFVFGDLAHGAYDGRTVSAYVEAGTVFEFGVFRLEPLAAVSFAALETDGYTETGTAGGNLLIVRGAEHESLRSYVGARFAYPFSLESGRKIVPEARVMWAHEFLDDQSRFVATLTSIPNNPFTVRGQEFARDGLLGGVGLNLPLSARATIYVDYDVFLSRDQVIQSASLGARVSW